MPSTNPSRFDPRDAEQLLTALAGIVSAHLVVDASGRLVEIHVLATPELHPKQVVRNIESALSAGLGIHVDRRIVSVAQIRADTNGGTVTPAITAGEASAQLEDTEAGQAEDTEPEATAVPSPQRRAPVPEPESGTRLEFVRYESRRANDRCECEVVLRGEREVVGTGAGSDTVAGRAEAAARAVLDAAMRARPGHELQLEGAVIASAHGRRYVIVSARSLLDRTTIPLTGAAPLAHSPEEAGILAALQASNRWIG